MNNLFQNKNEINKNIQNEYYMIQNMKKKEKLEVEAQKMENYE
jgi:hypothetical protein